jgi:hypothetical protein
MPTELIKITGLAEVQQTLRNMPRTLAAQAFFDALRAGVEPIMREVAARTPEASEGEHKEDQTHLIDALMCEIEIDSQGRGGHAAVGFGREGRKALWVEYGHNLVGHEPGKKLIGSVAPHPFMRPAADASADEAIAAVARVLESKVNGR